MHTRGPAGHLPTHQHTHLEVFEFLAVGNGEGVVVGGKAERQPAHKAVHQLSELCGKTPGKQTERSRGTNWGG